MVGPGAPLVRAQVGRLAGLAHHAQVQALAAAPVQEVVALQAVLDAPDGLQPLVDRTLEAAIRRGRELAAEADRRD